MTLTAPTSQLATHVRCLGRQSTLWTNEVATAKAEPLSGGSGPALPDGTGKKIDADIASSTKISKGVLVANKRRNHEVSRE